MIVVQSVQRYEPITRSDAYSCFTVTFKHYGINVKFVNDLDPASFEAAIDEKTKAIYIESIANPKYHMFDIPALAKVGFSSLLV
jgi:O-acetylhomoserine/O-acetylserine sulfhydrylase-like pyridoxal-dependent enzyme